MSDILKFTAADIATVLVVELAARDAAISVLSSRIEALEMKLAEKIDPDLDGRPANIKTAAQYYGFSPETIRRWCVQGRIDAAKDGGVWRIKI